VQVVVQHLVLGSASPASQASPASMIPFPHSARGAPDEKTAGGGAFTSDEGEASASSVLEGEFDRLIEELEEIEGVPTTKFDTDTDTDATGIPLGDDESVADAEAPTAIPEAVCVDETIEDCEAAAGIEAVLVPETERANPETETVTEAGAIPDGETETIADLLND